MGYKHLHHDQILGPRAHSNRADLQAEDGLERFQFSLLHPRSAGVTGRHHRMPGLRSTKDGVQRMLGEHSMK